MNQPFVITIDRGVSLDEKRKGSNYAGYKNSLMAMEFGDSFFLENQTRDDVRGLTRYAKKLGVHLRSQETDEDELYGEPGIRLERVPQDALPGRKPEVQGDVTYWRLGSHPCCRVQTMAPGDKPPASEGWSQIAPATYAKLVQECPDHVDYFYHPESDSFHTVPKSEIAAFEAEGSGVRFPGDDGLSNSIDVAAYSVGVHRTVVDPARKESKKALAKAAAAAKKKDLNPTYWRHPSVDLVVECLPGKPKEGGYIQVDRAEYDAHVARTRVKPEVPADVITYWRKSDGSVVEVPAKKFEVAKKTPGAVQVTRAEFDEYQTSLDTEDDDDL
jgi:hypothetical protein